MHMVPTGKGWAIEAVDNSTTQTTDNAASLWQAVARNSKSNGIIYHGGSIMPGAVHVYFIWYGNWSGGKARSDSQSTVILLESLFAKVGGAGSSAYAKTLSTYTDTKSTVAGAYYLAATTTDNYSKGKSLTDDSVKAIVTQAIQSGRLPKDPNGLYFVLSSSDVNETSGFCTKYCGWHYHGTILKSDIKYGFVGNSDRCAASCEAQMQSPNGNSGADGMASVLTHETAESITDPNLNAWYDASGQEVGDKCAWHWGPVKGTIGYGAYNQTFNGHHFLLQLLWENSRGGGCVQSKGGTFYNR
jgi:hypothetical protein